MNQIPEPPAPATEPLPAAPPAQEDLLGRRSGAALIDVALLTGVFVIFILMVGEIRTQGEYSATLNGAWSLVYLAVVLAYYFVFEVTVGQTVGKRLLGLRVVRADGSRPSAAAIAVRTLLRLVDWLPLLYLVGFVAMLATGVQRQRLGDLAAKTRVARALPVRHRSLALVPVVLVAVLLAGSAYYASATGRVTSNTARTIDPARIEAAITGNLERLKGEMPDLRVGRVACPKGVKLAQGVSFQCAAEVAGGQLPITVTVDHVDASTGDFEYRLAQAKALVDTDKAVEQIQAMLPVEAANATVDCGTPRVRVIEVDGKIECTVSLGSRRQVVHAVVDDAEGTVHFEPATVSPLTRPKVATGKIGDKMTIYDEFDAPQLEVTVTRLKFSAGDQFDQPEHGLYMGAYVKVHALADEQDILDMSALVGGHQYSGDAIPFSTAFEPSLDYVTLDTGERASGWLVFDVPARHGQLVLRDFEGHKRAVWKY
jgi:uncharacterized RDD family membrane protein YckC